MPAARATHIPPPRCRAGAEMPERLEFELDVLRPLHNVFEGPAVRVVLMVVFVLP